MTIDVLSHPLAVIMTLLILSQNTRWDEREGKEVKSASKAERPNRLQFLSGVFAGVVVLFLGLDIHFFHRLPNCPVGINHPLWIIMSAGGLLMIGVSIRNMIKPPSLRRKEDEELFQL